MQMIRDFRPDLRAAVDQLHGAGFDGEAHALAAALEGAYGTAVEMVDEIGSTVVRIQRTLGPDLPSGTERLFDRAMGEVRKVVPARREVR